MHLLLRLVIRPGGSSLIFAFIRVYLRFQFKNRRYFDEQHR